MYKQFVKQIQLASSVCLSLSPPWVCPTVSLSQVMCKRKVKCKADDGQTDWQIDKSSQLTENSHRTAPPRPAPSCRCIDLTPNQFVVWLASLWQSDDVPQCPLTWSPPAPSLCQCKQMHSELFATCSNIIKFQNRLTARGANCSFFLQQQQRLDLSLSLSHCLCLTLSPPPLCCVKLIIQTEQNSSRTPWIILINPARDSISYTDWNELSLQIVQRRSPALSAFQLFSYLSLSLFLFLSLSLTHLLFLSFPLFPWNTSLATKMKICFANKPKNPSA